MAAAPKRMRALDVLRRLIGAGRGEAVALLARLSPHFDPDWYRNAYPDVYDSGMDPTRHYGRFGHFEGRSPNPEHAEYGVASQASRLRFLLMKKGGRIFGDGRAKAIAHWTAVTRTSDFFDAEWYMRANADVRESRMEPAAHYANYGWLEGRNPGPRFNTRHYIDQMESAGDWGQFPLLHYETKGRKRNFSIRGAAAGIPAPFPTGPIRQPSEAAQALIIGVAAHVFYTDLAPDIAAAVGHIPGKVRLFLSTDTEAKAAVLRTVFGALDNADPVDIRVTPNRGRDLAPMLVAFADEILACDAVLHLHSKKSPYGSHLDGWRRHCIAHLADSPLYLDMILRRFREDEALGVIYPPPFPGAVPFMNWSGMRPDAEHQLGRIGLDRAILDAFPLEFPAGSMMWFRPAALRQLFAADWDWTDFPEEDGQSDGTAAHVIERLFFYIAHENGFTWRMTRPVSEGEGARLRLLDTTATPVPLPDPGADPLVSIIVPAHNQWETTALCLRALAEHVDPDRVPYEVILADDASTDDTVRAGALVPNLRVVRSDPNLGFLGNVNHAAAEARGRYLFLLNNDTQVQPGCIEALVDGFRIAPDAALVGAKLVYPDGTLQEAGGIIWEDASGANYGRGAVEPLAPEYSYFKDTDYVSGAAILVETAFWRTVGGFDPDFAPAYYEDTDLCFTARDRGRRVCLHPGAIVAHFEGKSHGTDIGAGIKAYQQVNRDRFATKWAAALDGCHAKGLSRARERSEDRPVIAVLDWEVPEYDRHAGGRYVWDYLKLMVARGFSVKFLASHVGEPRQLALAAEMQAMGIETLLPSNYLEEDHWRDWLTAEAGTLDAVLLSRPRLADTHLNHCRDLGLHTAFLCHDIHSLRAEREAEIRKDRALQQGAARMKSHEQGIFERASYVFTPSTLEETLLHTEFGISHAGVLPLHIQTDPPVARETVPGAPHLLFVGGMAHAPNPDGVRWFLDKVWPEISAAVPEAVFNVVGRAVPDDLLERADDRVRLLGGVSEAELHALYDTARVAVAPLRFGAGVKGKVIEAMVRGVPVVGTPVALEGIQGIEAVVPEAAEASAFARQVITLLQADADTWRDRSQQQAAFIADRFGADRAFDALRLGLGL